MKTRSLLQSARRHVRPVIAAGGLLALMLGLVLYFASSYFVDFTAQTASADALKPYTSAGAKLQNQAVVTANQTTQTTAGGAATPTQSCVPATKSLPAPLALTDEGGLRQQIDSPVLYQIYGNDKNALRSQIQKCAPRSEGHSDAQFTAETTYQLTWRYQTVNDDGVCSIQGASVGIHITQILPAWQPSTSASRGLPEQWNAFISALTAHENGHAAINVQYAQRLLNDLNNFPPTTCNQLAQSVKQLTDSDVSELEQANDNYDSTTNHGATQGAILP